MLSVEDPILSAEERLDTVNENIRLISRRDGLTYGTDAYLLAAFVKPLPRATVVDLGSGTGILPLLLTRSAKVARAVGVEVQPAFAELITRNAALNNLSAQVCALCADVRELSQRELGKTLGMPEGKTADVVVANPPYMRVGDGRRNEAEKKYIARHEVCGDIGDFCAAAGRILKYGGTFYVVYRPDRLTALMAALASAKFSPKRMTFVHADVESEPSMVLVEARAGGAEGLLVTPPLILYEVGSRGEKKRELTAAAQEVYEKMKLG